MISLVFPLRQYLDLSIEYMGFSSINHANIIGILQPILIAQGLYISNFLAANHSGALCDAVLIVLKSTARGVNGPTVYLNSLRISAPLSWSSIAS